MPGPPIARFDTSPDLPDAVDVVIIGGGIAGLSTALELVERGCSVALCEKGEIGAEQSSRNWGWIRTARRDPRELALMLEAQRLWSGLETRIGETVGYRRCGITFVAAGNKELERQRRWLEHTEPYQLSARLLDASAFRQAYPSLRFDGLGALHSPEDGRAEPQLATLAMARACRRQGASILTHCTARGIEHAAGRVSAVVTERGTIACDAVVVAGGAWSSLLLGSLGIRLPQLKLLSSALRTAPVTGGPTGSVWNARYSLRQRYDGGYTVATGHHNVAEIVPDSFRYFFEFLPALRAEWHALAIRVGRRSLIELAMPRRWALDKPSPFERCRVLDPRPAQRHPLDSLRALQADCPAFLNARVAQVWAGLIDVTPDALPVISPVNEIPGLSIATGFSGHGFGIAPAAGRLMADLVTGAPPLVDPAAFRLSRFSDGSPITLDAGGV